MNWEFIGKYLPMYEKAALLTVKIGVIGILFAILLGLVCAAIQYYKVPVLRWIVAVYVELSRNTPLLVQLFFIYYGFPKIGIRICGEYYFPVEGDQCIQCHQSDGSDVYGKGSDRPVL